MLRGSTERPPGASVVGNARYRDSSVQPRDDFDGRSASYISSQSDSVPTNESDQDSELIIIQQNYRETTPNEGVSDQSSPVKKETVQIDRSSKMVAYSGRDNVIIDEEQGSQQQVDRGQQDTGEDALLFRLAEEHFCDDALITLLTYAYKGMFRVSFNIYTNEQANTAGRTLARLIDRDSLLRSYPFKKRIDGELNDYRIDEVIRYAFKYAVQQKGFGPMTSAAMEPLNWYERLFAVPIIPTMLSRWNSRLSRLTVRGSSRLQKGDGIGGQFRPTYRSDMQWAIVTFNGACFTDYG